MKRTASSIFSDAQLKKYRQWFSLLDEDSSGTVDCGELSTVMLSTGILDNQKQVRAFFDAADVDNSGSICFQEFVSALESYVTQKRIDLAKLNVVVQAGQLLSRDTLLSVERRAVLMKHIVDSSTMRSRQMDLVLGAPVSKPRRRRFLLTTPLSMDVILAKNEIELNQVNESIRYISEIVCRCRSGLNELSPDEIDATSSSPLMPNGFARILPPIEDVLSPKALTLVSQKQWTHYSCSDESSLMAMPTENVSPVGAGNEGSVGRRVAFNMGRKF